MQTIPKDRVMVRKPVANASTGPEHASGSSVSPVKRIGEMALQTGFALRAAQSFPQQLVRLVGHRRVGDKAQVE